MTKSELETKLKQAEKRILELENKPNDLRVHRQTIQIDNKFYVNIYKMLDGTRFEFSEGINITPSANNSFTINKNRS